MNSTLQALGDVVGVPQGFFSHKMTSLEMMNMPVIIFRVFSQCFNYIYILVSGGGYLGLAFLCRLGG